MCVQICICLQICMPEKGEIVFKGRLGDFKESMKLTYYAVLFQQKNIKNTKQCAPSINQRFSSQNLLVNILPS